MAFEQGAAPLVSVVLPTYRRAGLLRHAIQSVLAQSHQNLELIVVDDCSPDETPAVVASFDDPRLHYHRNTSNLKLPGTLNRGFALSRGDFLSWTSDDNLYAPTALERMVSRLSRGDCDFVYTDYHDFSRSDPRTGAPLDSRPHALPDTPALQRCNQIGACFMYSRAVYEAVGDYDPELFLVEDYDYWIRISRCFTMAHIAEPLYYFRRDDNTLFCSRFVEVKAADVLVRFRNGLISEELALESLVELLAGNAERLSDPLLRTACRLSRRLSWRLGQSTGNLVRRRLRTRARAELTGLLQRFGRGESGFDESKSALCRFLNAAARIEYQ